MMFVALFKVIGYYIYKKEQAPGIGELCASPNHHRPPVLGPKLHNDLKPLNSMSKSQKSICHALINAINKTHTSQSQYLLSPV